MLGRLSNTRFVLLKRFYWGLRNGELSPLRILSDIGEQIRVLVVFFASVWIVKLSGIGHRSRTGMAKNYGGEREKNVLLISYYSSPYKSIYGTQRTAKFIKYLSRRGWNITLVTTRPSSPEEQDLISEPLPKNVDIVRLSPFRVRILAGKGAVVPDDFIPWVIPAVRAVRKVIEEKQIAVLYATAPPYSNLLIAAICSNWFDIPFVADFRDPWTKIDWGWVIHRPFLRWINNRLERAIFRTANKVIMSDDIKYKRDFFAATDGLDKVVSITNGFDEEDFARCCDGATTRRAGTFIISYVGYFYDEETFRNIFLPLKRWFERFPEDALSVRFEFAGHDGGRLEQLKSLPIRIKNNGYVSHSKAILIRRDSCAQLFVQPSTFKAHVLSGKIFEMIRVGVPILAITREDGAVADLICRTGTGFVVPPNDYERCAALMKELYEQWRSGELNLTPNKDVIMQYSREALADRLAMVFNETLNRPTSINL